MRMEITQDIDAEISGDPKIKVCMDGKQICLSLDNSRITMSHRQFDQIVSVVRSYETALEAINNSLKGN